MWRVPELTVLASWTWAEKCRLEGRRDIAYAADGVENPMGSEQRGSGSSRALTERK
jgi:hypothetical protein